MMYNFLLVFFKLLVVVFCLIKFEFDLLSHRFFLLLFEINKKKISVLTKKICFLKGKTKKSGKIKGKNFLFSILFSSLIEQYSAVCSDLTIQFTLESPPLNKYTKYKSYGSI